MAINSSKYIGSSGKFKGKLFDDEEEKDLPEKLDPETIGLNTLRLFENDELDEAGKELNGIRALNAVTNNAVSRKVREQEEADRKAREAAQNTLDSIGPSEKDEWESKMSDYNARQRELGYGEQAYSPWKAYSGVSYNRDKAKYGSFENQILSDENKKNGLAPVYDNDYVAKRVQQSINLLSKQPTVKGETYDASHYMDLVNNGMFKEAQEYQESTNRNDNLSYDKKSVQRQMDELINGSEIAQALRDQGVKPGENELYYFFKYYGATEAEKEEAAHQLAIESNKLYEDPKTRSTSGEQRSELAKEIKWLQNQHDYSSPLQVFYNDQNAKAQARLDATKAVEKQRDFLEYTAKNGMANTEEFNKYYQEWKDAQNKAKASEADYISKYAVAEKARQDKLSFEQVEALAKEWRDKADAIAQTTTNGVPGTYSVEYAQAIKNAKALENALYSFATDDELKKWNDEASAEFNASKYGTFNNDEYEALLLQGKTDEAAAYYAATMNDNGTSEARQRMNATGRELESRLGSGFLQDMAKYEFDVAQGNVRPTGKKNSEYNAYTDFVNYLNKADQNGNSTMIDENGNAIMVDPRYEEKFRKALINDGYTDREASTIINYVEKAVNQVQVNQLKEYLTEAVSKNAFSEILWTAASVGTNLFSGVGMIAGLEAALDNSYNPTLDANSRWLRPQIITNTIRETVQNDIDWDANILGKNVDVFDTSYGIVTSWLDSLAAAYVGSFVGGVFFPGLGETASFLSGSGKLAEMAGEVVAGLPTSAIMGMTAAAETMVDISDRGGTALEAFTGGMMSGVFEGLFETFSISQFNALSESAKMASIREIAENLGKSFLTNGSEEFFTEVANIVYDRLANGDISEYNQSIERYKNEYMRYFANPALDPADAEVLAYEYGRKQTAKDQWDRAKEAGITGALQGLLMAGTGMLTRAARSQLTIEKINNLASVDVKKLSTPELERYLHDASSTFNTLASVLSEQMSEDVLTQQQKLAFVASRDAFNKAVTELGSRQTSSIINAAESRVSASGAVEYGKVTFLDHDGKTLTEQSYRGDSKNGKANGFGVAWDTVGNAVIGQWKDGVFQSGIRFLNDGTFRTVTQKDGKTVIGDSTKQIAGYGENAIPQFAILDASGFEINDALFTFGENNLSLSDAIINGQISSYALWNAVTNSVNAADQWLNSQQEDRKAPTVIQVLKEYAAERKSKRNSTPNAPAQAKAQSSTAKAAQNSAKNALKKAGEKPAAGEYSNEENPSAATVPEVEVPRNSLGKFDPIKLLDMVVDGKVSYEQALDIVRQEEGQDAIKFFELSYKNRTGQDQTTVEKGKENNDGKQGAGEQPGTGEPANADAAGGTADGGIPGGADVSGVRQDQLERPGVRGEDDTGAEGGNVPEDSRELEEVPRQEVTEVNNPKESRSEKQVFLQNLMEKIEAAESDFITVRNETTNELNKLGINYAILSNEAAKRLKRGPETFIFPDGTTGIMMVEAYVKDDDMQKEITDLLNKSKSGFTVIGTIEDWYQIVLDHEEHMRLMSLDDLYDDGLIDDDLFDAVNKIISEQSAFRESAVRHEENHYIFRHDDAFAKWLVTNIDSIFNLNGKFSERVPIISASKTYYARNVREYIAAIAKNYNIDMRKRSFEQLSLKEKLLIAEEYINVAYCQYEFYGNKRGYESFNNFDEIYNLIDNLPAPDEALANSQTPSTKKDAITRAREAKENAPKTISVEQAADDVLAEKAETPPVSSPAMMRDNLEQQRRALQDELAELRQQAKDSIYNRAITNRISQIESQLILINDLIKTANEAAKGNPVTQSETAPLPTNIPKSKSEAVSPSTSEAPAAKPVEQAGKLVTAESRVATLEEQNKAIAKQMYSDDTTLEQKRELFLQQNKNKAEINKLNKKLERKKKSNTFTFLTEERQRNFNELTRLVRESKGRPRASTLRAYGYTLDSHGNLILDPAALHFTEGGVEAFSAKLADMVNLKSRLVKAGQPYTWIDLQRSMKKHNLDFAAEKVTGRVRNPGLFPYARVNLPVFYYSTGANADAISDPISHALATNYAELEKNQAAHVLFDYFAPDENGESVYANRRKELYDTLKVCALQDSVASIYDAIEKNEAITVYDPTDKYNGSNIGNNLKKIRLKENGGYINPQISFNDVLLGTLYDYLDAQAQTIVTSERNLTEDEAHKDVRIDVSEAEKALSQREGVTTLNDTEEVESPAEDEENADVGETLPVPSSSDEENDYDHGEIATKLGMKETRNYDDPVFRAVLARLLGVEEQEVETLLGNDRASLEYNDLFGEDAGYGISGSGARGGILTRFDASDDPIRGKRPMKLVTADQLFEFFNSDPDSVADFANLFYDENAKYNKIASGRAGAKNFNLNAKALIVVELIRQTKAQDTKTIDVDFDAEKHPMFVRPMLEYMADAISKAFADYNVKQKVTSEGRAVNFYDDFLDQDFVPEQVFKAAKDLERGIDIDRNLASDYDFAMAERGNALTPELFEDMGAKDGEAALKAYENYQASMKLYDDAIEAWKKAVDFDSYPPDGPRPTIWTAGQANDTPEAKAVRQAFVNEWNAAKELKAQVGRTQMYHFTESERKTLEGDIEITVEEDGVPVTKKLSEALDEQEDTIIGLETALNITLQAISDNMDEIESLEAEREELLKERSKYEEDDEYHRKWYDDEIKRVDNELRNVKEALSDNKFDRERLQYGIDQSKKRFEVLKRGIDAYIEPQIKVLNDSGITKSVLSAGDDKTQDKFRVIMDANGVIYIYTPKNISAASGDTRAKGKNSIGVTSYEFAHDLYASDPYFLYMGETAFKDSQCYALMESIARAIWKSESSRIKTIGRKTSGSARTALGYAVSYSNSDEERVLSEKLTDGRDSYGNVIAQKSYELQSAIDNKVSKQKITNMTVDLLREFLQDPTSLQEKINSSIDDEQSRKNAIDAFGKLAETVLSGEDLEDLLWWHDRYRTTYTIAALAWLDRNRAVLDEDTAGKVDQSLTQTLREENLTDDALAAALFGYMTPTSNITIEELNKIRKYVREYYETLFKMNEDVWEDIGYGQRKTNITNLIDPQRNKNLYRNIDELDKFEVILGRPANSMFAEGMELRVYDGADGEVRQIILDRDADWTERNAAMMLALNLLENFQMRRVDENGKVHGTFFDAQGRSVIPVDPVRSYANAKFYETATDLTNLDSHLSRLHVVLENGIKKGIPKAYEKVIREAIDSGNAYTFLKDYMRKLRSRGKANYDAFRSFLYEGQKDGTRIFTNAREDTVSGIMFYLDQLSGSSDIQRNYAEAAKLYSQMGFKVPSDPDSAKQLMIQAMANYLVSDAVVNMVDPNGATLKDVITVITGQTEENLLSFDDFSKLIRDIGIDNLNVNTVDYGTQYKADEAAYKRQQVTKYAQTVFDYDAAVNMEDHNSPLYRFASAIKDILKNYDGEYRTMLDEALKQDGIGVFEAMRQELKDDDDLRALVFGPGISEARVMFNLLNLLYDDHNLSLAPSSVYDAMRKAGMEERGIDIAQKPDESTPGAQYVAQLREYLKNGGEKPNPRTEVNVTGDALHQFVDSILLTINFRDKDMRRIRYFLSENDYDALGNMFRKLFTDNYKETDLKKQYEIYQDLYYKNGKKSRFEVAGRRLNAYAQYISNITHQVYTADNLLNDILTQYGDKYQSARLGAAAVTESVRAVKDIDSRYRMTQKSFDKLKQELQELETTRMKEVAEQIKAAREQGDLSENSEYKAAKEEQDRLYARITDLKDRIKNAQIDNSTLKEGVAGRGRTVKLTDLDSKNALEISLVDSEEASPLKGKVSIASPIGDALVGRKVGDTIELDTQDGKVRYKIDSVEESAEETAEDNNTNDLRSFYLSNKIALKEISEIQKNIQLFSANAPLGSFFNLDAFNDPRSFNRAEELVKYIYRKDDSITLPRIPDTAQGSYERYLQSQRRYIEEVVASMDQRTVEDFERMIQTNAEQRALQLKYILSTFRNLLDAYAEDANVSERLFDYMYGLYEDNLIYGRDGVLDLFRGPGWTFYESEGEIGMQWNAGATILNREIYSVALRLGYADALTDAIAKYDMYNVANGFYRNIMELANSFEGDVFGTNEFLNCVLEAATDELNDYVDDVQKFISSVNANPMLLMDQPEAVKRLYYSYAYAAAALNPTASVKSGAEDGYSDVASAIKEICKRNPQAEWSIVEQASGEDILTMLCATFDTDIIESLDEDGQQLYYDFCAAALQGQLGQQITAAMSEFLQGRNAESERDIRENEKTLLNIYFNDRSKTLRSGYQSYHYMTEGVDTSLATESDRLMDEQDSGINAFNAGYFLLLKYGDGELQARAEELLEKELATSATFESVRQYLAVNRGMIDTETLPENIMRHSMYFADDPNFKAYMCGAIAEKFYELENELKMQTSEGQKATEFRLNRIKGSIASHEQIMQAVNLYNLAVQYANASRSIENLYSIWKTGYLNVAEMIRDWITTHAHDNVLSAQISRAFTHSNPDFEAHRLISKLNGVAKSITGAEELLVENGYSNYYQLLGLTYEDFVNYRNALITQDKKTIKAAFDNIAKKAGKEVKSNYPLTKRLTNGMTAWRYAAMLSNLTTHGNNLVSTAVNIINNDIAALPTFLMEQNAIKHGRMDQSEATVAPVSRVKDKELFEKAAEDYATAKQYLYDRGKLGSRISEIMRESGSVFGTKNPLTIGLEMEDRGIGFGVYQRQFAQILKARGLTADAFDALSDIEKAKIQAIAVDQTQTILFRNLSTISKMLGNFNNTRIGKALIAPILPFATIAGNLATTAYETSIFGLFGVGWDALAQKIANSAIFDENGDVIASNIFSEALYKAALATQARIDASPQNAKSQRYRKISLSMVGLVGTMLGVIGRAVGMISAGGDGDDDLARLEAANGYQKYSILIGDKYYDLTRAFPASFSLLLGAKLADIFMTGNHQFGDIFTETFANNTFVGNILDSANRFTESIGALNNDKDLEGLMKVMRGANARLLTQLQNYATQFFPGLIKTMENTLWEENKDTFFYDKSSDIPYSIQYIISDFFEMIPGVDMYRADKRDMYGEPTQHETMGEYLLRVLTGTTSELKENDYDAWLYELANKTDPNSKDGTGKYASRVIYDEVKKSLPVGGQRMTAEEYAAYTDTVASMRRKIYSTLTYNKIFQNATDEEKASVIEYINTMINEHASNRVKEMRGTLPKNEPYYGNEYIGEGNIDLHNLAPIVDDEGNWMTTYSYTIPEGDKWVNIPGVVTVDGKRQAVDEETAIKAYKKTGEYFGKFDTLAKAEAAADALHLEQEEFYDLSQSDLAALIDIADKTEDFTNYALLKIATQFTGSDNYEPDFEFVEGLMDNLENFDPLVQNAILKNSKFGSLYEAYQAFQKVNETKGMELKLEDYWNLDNAVRAANAEDTPQNLDALSDYILNTPKEILDYYQEKKDGFGKLREAAEVGKEKGFGLSQYDHVRDVTSALFNDGATDEEMKAYDRARKAASDDLLDLISNQYDTYEKLYAANEAGYDTPTFFKVYDIHKALSKNKALKPQEQLSEFMHTMLSEFKNVKDAEFFIDLLPFTSGYTVEDKNFNKFKDYGFDTESAMYVSDLFDSLGPINGYDTVRPCQRIIALDDAYKSGALDNLGLSKKEWQDFLYSYMGTNTKYSDYASGIRYYQSELAKTKKK